MTDNGICQQSNWVRIDKLMRSVSSALHVPSARTATETDTDAWKHTLGRVSPGVFYFHYNLYRLSTLPGSSIILHSLELVSMSGPPGARRSSKHMVGLLLT